MIQNLIFLGKERKACVRTATFFDDKIGGFGHTALRRDAFGRLWRRKCSTVLAPSCASLLKLAQNRSRLNKSLICRHCLTKIDIATSQSKA